MSAWLIGRWIRTIVACPRDATYWLPYEHRTGVVRGLWVVASSLSLHSGHIDAARGSKEAS
jgi:hypothetical protein